MANEHLTMSRAEMLATIVNNADDDADVSHLTHSEAELWGAFYNIATLGNDPAPHLSRSIPAMMAGIANGYGGSVSHLTSSPAELTAAIANALGADPAVSAGTSSFGAIMDVIIDAGAEPPAGTVPEFTGSTFIYGNAEVGGTLICVAGARTGSPSPTLTYQWRAATVPIDGATNDEFTVTSSEIGDEIDCVVTATNSEGSDTSNSNGLTVPSPAAAPTVSAIGTEQFGIGDITVAWPTHAAGDLGILSVETANQEVPTPSTGGTWEIMASSPQSGGTTGGTNGYRGSNFIIEAVDGAMPSVTITDVGDHALGVITVVSGADGIASVYTSAGDTATPGTNPLSMPQVTTDGDDHLLFFTLMPRIDSATDTISGFASADGTAVEHLNVNVAAGNGGGLGIYSVVKATAGASGAATFSMTDATLPVPRMTYAIRGAGGDSGPVNSVAPAITGTTTEGSTLTVSNGTWTGTATITYTRQWYRNGSPISAATGSTYELVGADVGTTITAIVTASNTYGLVQAAASGVGPIAPFDEPAAGIGAAAIGSTFVVG